MKSYPVIRNGQVEYYLNHHWIESKGISDETAKKLCSRHSEKLDIFDKMEATDDPELLKKLAKLVECIEFDLQKLWGLPQSKKWHEWYKVPKCQCPTLDNMDARGSSINYINMACPIHGGYQEGTATVDL